MRALIFNITGETPFSSKYFLLEQHEWRCTAEMINADGLFGVGSTVFVMRKKRLIKTLLAIYWDGVRWMFFDGENHLRLESMRATWSKGWWFFGLFQRASLTLSGPAAHGAVVYLRPPLRHWFADGWTLDDIDIGYMIADLITDEHARKRVLNGLLKQVA